MDNKKINNKLKQQLNLKIKISVLTNQNNNFKKEFHKLLQIRLSSKLKKMSIDKNKFDIKAHISRYLTKILSDNLYLFLFPI